MYLRLKNEAGQLTGTLRTADRTFKVQGALKDSRLEGEFGEGTESWPFSIASDGRSLTFSANTFSTVLQRQMLPPLSGVYTSEHIWLKIEEQNGQHTGTLKFNGKEYSFTAAVVADDLEGMFNDGKQAFPFAIANEPKRLVFQSGPFAEAITLKAKDCELQVEVSPSTEFVLKVDGTEGSGTNARFMLPADKPLVMEVQASGYESAKKTMTLPAYGSERWVVALEKVELKMGQAWTIPELDLVMQPIPPARFKWAAPMATKTNVR